MEDNKNDNSKLKYFNPSSLTEQEVKKIKYYLRDSGMDEIDIYKIFSEYGLLDEYDQVKIADSNYKGKGKK